MCISSSPTACSAWTSFANTAPFRLDRTSGVATVYVQLRDPWQNQSREPLTDTILVDTSAPTVSSLRGAQSGAGRIALDWAASDAGSGVASYQLQYARGAVPPANCNGGQRLYAGELTSFAHAALPVGKHAYRLCATDRAGHTTLGKTLVFSVR